MILDTSAIVALMHREPGYQDIASALGSADHRRISAGTLLELRIVVQRSRIPGLVAAVDRFLETMSPEVESVTAAQVQIAADAYRRFGKGSGHPAKLNFGDCFAYALAREKNEPLLFVGNDFSHTDIRPALTL